MSTIETATTLFDQTEASDGYESQGRTRINRTLSVVDQGGARVVFHWHEPLYRLALSDTLSLRFVAVHIRLGDLATQEEISQAFGHSVATQRRWEKRYQGQGLQGLEKGKSTGRPRRVPETCDLLLRKWFAQNVSNVEMARRLMVSEAGIHRTLARLGLRRRTPTSAELPGAIGGCESPVRRSALLGASWSVTSDSAAGGERPAGGVF